MAILVIDGPEKAGKTTLIQMMKAQEPALEVVKWYQPKWYGEYKAELIRALALPKGALVVWDRSWASDAVYSKLMPKVPRRFLANEEAGEAQLGRYVGYNGLRVILGGPAAPVLAARRTADDLPVAPLDEQRAFIEYGEKWGWLHLSEASPTLATALLIILKAIESRRK